MTANASYDVDLRALDEVARDASEAALRDAQEDIAGAARSTVHVITGLLRSRIAPGRLDSSAGGRAEAEVVADTDYAVYEHEGTRHRPPHPYFTEAIDRVASSASDARSGG